MLAELFESFRDAPNGLRFTRAANTGWCSLCHLMSVARHPRMAAGSERRIAAISANDIWAVGHGGDPGSIPLKTLTEHWNGTSWSIIPSPNPGTYNGNVLNAVDGVSANDVWAVGCYQLGSTGQDGGALTMHWNGAQWTVVPAPSRSTLYGITALASNNVWAVGDQVILHWNGTSWNNVSFPLPPNGSFPRLRGISAVSANDIWAAGFSQ